jgi:N-acetylglucosamine-6-phosphate deacetylase
MPDGAILEPSRELLDDILEAGKGTIVEMTIAPELPGALDIILELARNGIVPSLGHSDATLNETLRAIDHGARHVTHFYNAMRPIHHREPGLTGAALFSLDITIEMIVDGFHLHPWMVGLALQNKTFGLSCLITDAMQVTGFPDGTYESLGMNVSLEEGRLSLADDPSTLAGSVLTMDRAVANTVNTVGIPLQDAVAMASATPAMVAGFEDRKGRLAEGFDADITVLDDQYNAVLTIVEGEIVYNTLENQQ